MICALAFIYTPSHGRVRQLCFGTNLAPMVLIEFPSRSSSGWHCPLSRFERTPLFSARSFAPPISATFRRLAPPKIVRRQVLENAFLKRHFFIVLRRLEPSVRSSHPNLMCVLFPGLPPGYEFEERNLFPVFHFYAVRCS